MISNIILHIGIHKTATTTIQNTLTDNREQLAANGILYPLFYANEFLWNNHSIPFFSLFTDFPDQYHINKSHGFTTSEAIGKLHQGYRDQLRAQAASFQGDTMVLSGEDISFLNTGQLKNLKNLLHEVTHPGVNIRIVVVCRHPVSRFRSALQFTVSNFGMRLEKAIEFHLMVKRKNYKKLIRTFATVFGRDNITLLKYEDMLVYEFGPAGKLLEIIDPSIPGIIKPKVLRDNAGFTYEAVLLCNAINHAWPDPPGFSLHAERLFPVIPLLSRMPGTKFDLPKEISRKVWKELSEDIHWLTTEFSLTPFAESDADIPFVNDRWSQQTIQYLMENLHLFPTFYRKAIGKGLLKIALTGQMIAVKRRLAIASFLLSNRKTLFGNRS